MKVFVAGATGVLGRQAVRRLAEAGHDVTGVARTDDKAALVVQLGATPVRIDVFDPDEVRSAVHGHDVVCNLATNIPASARVVMRSAWHTNDRLHTEASRNLVDATLAAGASRYIQHSAAFMYADGGDRWLDEDAEPDPPPHGECLQDAERQARRVTEAGGTGIALRFALFYGADAGTTKDQLRIARLRICPIPGASEAFYPSIHTDDLGTAVVAAVDAPSGAYNVGDDEPLTRVEHAQALAAAIGAKHLRIMRMPIKRMSYIARSQRVSNKRFKAATGWSPVYRSAREGWPAVVAASR